MPSLLQPLCPAWKPHFIKTKSMKKKRVKNSKAKGKRLKTMNTTPMLIIANTHLHKQELHATVCRRHFTSFNSFHGSWWCNLGLKENSKRLQLWWSIWERNRLAETLWKMVSAEISDGKAVFGKGWNLKKWTTFTHFSAKAFFFALYEISQKWKPVNMDPEFGLNTTRLNSCLGCRGFAKNRGIERHKNFDFLCDLKNNYRTTQK